MRILFVVTREPDINGQADQFTTAQAIRYLRGIGVEVELCVLKASSYTSLEFLREAFAGIFKGRPLQTSLYVNRYNRERLRDRISRRGSYDRIYCHLIRSMVAAEVVNISDIHLGMQISQGLNFSRIAKELPVGFKKLLYFLESQLCRYYEKQIANDVRRTNFVGSQDPEYLKLDDSPSVTIIPHGIDTDFALAPKHRRDLIFLANFSSEANRAAFHLLVDRIMPQLRMKYPEVTLTVCGRNMPAEFFNARSPGVSVDGEVENALAEISGHRILLNPVRAAAGMQNKVLAGLAAAVPVVSFRSAVAGMHLPYQTCTSVDGTVDAFVDAVSNYLDEYPSLDILEETQRAIKKDWSWSSLHQRWARDFLELSN